jgi:soluble cytochrome b562
MLRFASTEELFTSSLTEFIYSNEDKMNGFLFGDGNFRLEDPYHRQYNYNLPLSIIALYKTRYGMFLELFRYLYDFMAMGLSIRINYYEAFLRKAAEFTDFFRDIKVTKLNLHGQSFSQSVKTAAVRDKVNKLRSLIEDRERLVAKKTQEYKELELELKVNQDEIDHVVEQKDAAIDEMLAHIEKVTGSEFMHIVSSQTKFNDKEQHLLRCFAILVEKTDMIDGYDREKHGSYFHDRDELIDLLDERRGFNFDESCSNHFKELTL